MLRLTEFLHQTTIFTSTYIILKNINFKNTWAYLGFIEICGIFMGKMGIKISFSNELKNREFSEKDYVVCVKKLPCQKA